MDKFPIKHVQRRVARRKMKKPRGPLGLEPLFKMKEDRERMLVVGWVDSSR
jgi:hypothetical protein